MDRKEKIREIALELFASKGYLGASMSDIAKRLNITKGALYKHYKSKQEIFDSILDKMREVDEINAKKFDLPTGEQYSNVSMKKLCDYALSQFTYWTEDKFPSLFRKLLTIEQYRSDKMKELYQQYLVAGQLEYVEKIFVTKGVENPKEKAVEFFSPLFLCYNLMESGFNKKEIYSILENHFNSFMNKESIE